MRPRQLPANQAQALREDRAAGALARDLAVKYGVSICMVYDVVHGKTYQDVGGPTCAPKPKLTPTAVVALRQAHSYGVPQDSLAVQYGIPRSTIWDVLTGGSWAAAGGPLAPRRARLPAQPEVDEVDEVDEIAVERALEDIIANVPLSVRLTKAERDEVIRMVPDGRREVARVRLKVNITAWRRAMDGAA
jgi:hypothetical protein